MRILKYIEIIDPKGIDKDLTFLKDIEEIKSSLSDVKLMDDHRLTIAVFLYLYPVKNKKVFKKLDGKKKMGYISRHIMSVGNQKGLSDLVDQYVSIKEKAKSAAYFKESDYWKRRGNDPQAKLTNFVKEEKYKKELEIRKRDLRDITVLLTEKIISKYNKRVKKINDILES